MLFSVLSIFHLLPLSCSSVIGVDYGSELIKVSLIHPGKPLTIVENEQSKRSTPSVLSFTEQGRVYGNNALKEFTKRPDSTLLFSQNLFSSPITSHFNRTFQTLATSSNPERNSTLIDLKGKSYEIEEINAMLLEHVREMSNKFAESNLTECAITVPSFWNRGQRVALINTALAAGLNVLGLVNENTAAAVYYAIDRWDNSTSHFVLFVNLGASYLQVSVARYAVGFKKNLARNVQSVEVLAHSADDGIGGNLFDVAIALRVAEKFEEKYGIALKGMNKVMARILMQANLAKKTLSANKSTQIVLSSLINGIDFIYTLTREEFEEMISPLMSKLSASLQKAISKAQLTYQNISSLEIIGGLTRIPKIQEVIKESTGLHISSHLNGDESSALGASLFAANLSDSILIRPILLTDISTYSYYIRMISESDPDWVKELVIFDDKSQIPGNKKIMFEYNKDFNIVLAEALNDQVKSICLYVVKGITQLNSEKVQIYLHFVIDVSGIPYLNSVDVKYEEIENVTVVENIKRDGDDEVRLNLTERDGEVEKNLTSGQKKEFGEGLGDNETGGVGENFTLPEDKGNGTLHGNNEVNRTASSDLGNNKTDNETGGNSTKDHSSKNLTVKFKHIVAKFQQVELETPLMLTPAQVSNIITSLNEQKIQELEANQLYEAKNDLESYIYFASEKLEDDSFQTFSTPNQTNQLSLLLQDLRTWIESPEFQNSSISSIHSQKSKIDSIVSPILQRETESKIRDQVVESCKEKVSKIFSDLLKLNETKAGLVEDEIKLLQENLTSFLSWLSEKVSEQASLSPRQDPVFLCQDLQLSIESFSAELEKISNLAKQKFIQKKSEEKQSKSSKNNTNTDL